VNGPVHDFLTLEQEIVQFVGRSGVAILSKPDDFWACWKVLKEMEKADGPSV